MSITDVMDGLGGRLATITSPPLRVYDFPADAITVPAGIVLFPETLIYDDTMARGADRATFQLLILVGKVSDRAARDELALYMAGAGARSIKETVEEDKTLGGAAQTTRVTQATVETFTVGGADYLGCRFTLDVVA